MSDRELVCFVEHIDKDNNGIITFEAWRGCLLLYPHEVTIQNIYQYWEIFCAIDIGEQATIPKGISKHIHAIKYFIAGGVAGALSRMATTPLDRLKVKLQVQTSGAHVAPSMKEIFREGVVFGFFQGNGISVLKVAPESAIKFYAYEMMKNLVVSVSGEEHIVTFGRLLAGGIAGSIAYTIIYPMDLVKTRLQTYTGEGRKIPRLSKILKDIWVHEGPRVFYRGLLPSILGIIPNVGIDLVAYETLKDMSEKHILKDTGQSHNFSITASMILLRTESNACFANQCRRNLFFASYWNFYLTSINHSYLGRGIGINRQGQGCHLS